MGVLESVDREMVGRAIDVEFRRLRPLLPEESADRLVTAAKRWALSVAETKEGELADEDIRAACDWARRNQPVWEWEQGLDVLGQIATAMVRAARVGHRITAEEVCSRVAEKHEFSQDSCRESWKLTVHEINQAVGCVRKRGSRWSRQNRGFSFEGSDIVESSPSEYRLAADKQELREWLEARVGHMPGAEESIGRLLDGSTFMTMARSQGCSLSTTKRRFDEIVEVIRRHLVNDRSG